jgi:RNA polymerase sigma-70 factor (ECF subfamily)
LRVFLDLDVAQTAAALGLAEGTVTAHMARAVATLRPQLMPAHLAPDRRDT